MWKNAPAKEKEANIMQIITGCRQEDFTNVQKKNSAEIIGRATRYTEEIWEEVVAVIFTLPGGKRSLYRGLFVISTYNKEGT